MKIVSQAQNRFFRACAQSGMDGCPPQKVVDEGIDSVHGVKVRHFPQHVMDGKPYKGRFPNSKKVKF